MSSNKALTRGLSCWGIAFCLLLICSLRGAASNMVLYPTMPDHQSDGKITGSINGQPATFEYQYTYHIDSQGLKDFKANYVRLAADGPVDVDLTVVNTTITKAYLRTVGKDLPFSRNGSSFRFTLPGPGNYYLQLPDLNSPRQITYTVFFFVDDLAEYNSYQQLFAAAKNVTNYNVVSDATRDQTSAVQSVLNSGGSIYFPPGIYRTGPLTLNSNTTVYLAPGALLKGLDYYNASRYIYINGKQNVRIAGLGTIDANGTPTGHTVSCHGIDFVSSSYIYLDDIIFRNTNSWMLHIQKSDQIFFDSLKLFSGKDGIDPDGSRDVSITRTVIQSIDDGFAVKSKFSGRTCERVTMQDCIVFSCASSLKIGTENYYGKVSNITWDRCDAVDADRACIVYTKLSTGIAPISNITWRNIRVFNFSWSAETGGAPFQFENNTSASVTNLVLENIVAYPTQNCANWGPLNATFRNVIVNGSSTIPTSNMSFQGVIWPGITSISQPVVFIDPSPFNQNEYRNGDTVTVSVQHPFNRAITRVEMLVDGVSIGTDTSAPYSFTLSNLSTAVHLLQAKATDIDGAVSTTAPSRIKILQGTTPVMITINPSISDLTHTSATVSWSTNLAGNSIVEYGTTTAYGTTASDPALVTGHTITLSNLTPETTYHYRVKTQASGYLDGVSNDAVFTTLPAPTALINPGFEDVPGFAPWVRYGVYTSTGFDGVQPASWYGMSPHSGTYFSGSAGSRSKKNGGLYQTLTASFIPGQYWVFSAWVNTYNKGSVPSDTNNRIGIDPTGGTSPTSANIIWSQRTSTQYQWQQISVAAPAAADSMTFFIEAQQNLAVEMNVNAFDDCAIAQIYPTSIPEALALSDNTAVSIEKSTVTAGTSEIGGACYIEEPDRSVGIRVATGAAVNRGDTVIVTGKMSTNDQGERQIIADFVSATQPALTTPKPLFISNNNLGGKAYNSLTQGAWQGSGLYNIGLLVTCFGSITAQGTDYFYIDDGSNLQDGSGNTGIRIDAAGLTLPTHTYAIVTGISTLRMVNGKAVRTIKPRSQADIL